MRLCVDSTFLAPLARGDPVSATLLDRWNADGTTLVTTEMNYCEVKLGLEREEDRAKRLRCMERFEKALEAIEVIGFGRDAAEVAVKRQLELFRKGRPAPSIDLFVAAVAVANACDAIVTRNAFDFDRIGLLPVQKH